MKGRLLEKTMGDPYANLAFEEAMLREAEVPTLRVWENQRSVVIGRGQLAEFETDVGLCRSRSIPIVRRCTAGGAVFNGPGTLNWSFVVPEVKGGARETLDAKGVFSGFATMLVEALERCGVSAEFDPPNSVRTSEGKVSGLAAYVSRKGTLCHGTLLVSADLGEVQELTRPKDVDLPRKYPRSRFAEVANCGVSVPRLVGELAFSGGGYERGEATDAELKACEGLRGRYSSDAWNLGDPFP